MKQFGWRGTNHIPHTIQHTAYSIYHTGSALLTMPYRPYMCKNTRSYTLHFCSSEKLWLECFARVLRFISQNDVLVVLGDALIIDPVILHASEQRKVHLSTVPAGLSVSLQLCPPPLPHTHTHTHTSSPSTKKKKKNTQRCSDVSAKLPGAA